MIHRIRAYFERQKLDPDYRKKLDRLEELTGVPAREPDLYLKALRHRSIVAEKRMASNESYEQLEFMGDAVLDLIVSEIIFEEFPYSDEGFMTQLRSRLVKGEMLAEIARNIELADLIELGDRVRNQGVEHTDNVLSDVFEAVVGAVFIDHGYLTCRKFVMNLYHKYIILDELVATKDNYKSILLERVQARRQPAPVYRITRERGPGHMKEFEVEVVVDGRTLGRGIGKNKKKAEQAAARSALDELDA
ncbi:ribonuclease III [Balneolales bacterium ANBcel1]|nr:ribonuclease III [Balneolales bacterium ANBcel1]